MLTNTDFKQICAQNMREISHLCALKHLKSFSKLVNNGRKNPRSVAFIRLLSLTLPRTTERTGQHRNPPLLQFSTHTLCWTGSRRDNWGTGSGRCLASPLHHRRLHRRREARFYLQLSTLYEHGKRTRIVNVVPS